MEKPVVAMQCSFYTVVMKEIILDSISSLPYCGLFPLLENMALKEHEA